MNFDRSLELTLTAENEEKADELFTALTAALGQIDGVSLRKVPIFKFPRNTTELKTDEDLDRAPIGTKVKAIFGFWEKTDDKEWTGSDVGNKIPNPHGPREILYLPGADK